MSTTGGPYVGLDYFVEEDAGLFFGRDAERKRIIGNLRASRLTLLYAESGVGKSSLLRAGVVGTAPAARRAQRRRAGLGALRPGGLQRVAGRPEGRPDRRARGRRAVRCWATATSWRSDATRSKTRSRTSSRRWMRHRSLILDQFEEHFLYEPDERRFDDELARCINRRDLRANFLISVREDAYSLIGPRFKARIPNVYGNYLHLDFLDERAARDAVARTRQGVQRAPAGRRAALRGRDRARGRRARAGAPRAGQHRRRRGTGRRRERSGPRGDGLPAARHEAAVGRRGRALGRSDCGWRRCGVWAARTRSSTGTSTTSWPSCPPTSATPPPRRSASS